MQLVLLFKKSKLIVRKISGPLNLIFQVIVDDPLEHLAQSIKKSNQKESLRGLSLLDINTNIYSSFNSRGCQILDSIVASVGHVLVHIFILNITTFQSSIHRSVSTSAQLALGEAFAGFYSLFKMLSDNCDISFEIRFSFQAHECTGSMCSSAIPCVLQYSCAFQKSVT